MKYPKKSLNPEDRLGVYKSLSDVPQRYRLENYAKVYEGEDVWQRFCEEFEYEHATYDRYERQLDIMGQKWKEFMAGQNRHHALATPDDIEAWCRELRVEQNKTLRRMHDHWLRIDRFYRWLQWHVEYPHVYRPPLMAVLLDGHCAEAWRYKAEQNQRARDKYYEETEQ